MYLYKDEFCHISYLDHKKLIYLKWLQKPNDEALLKAYTKGIEGAIKFDAVGWVTDNSIGFLLDLSMQRTLAEVTIEKLSELKLARFARVVPEDVFQDLVTHRISNLINEKSCTKIEIEVFSELLEAEEWAAQNKRTLASAC
jgi:hypothetical protein